MKTVAIISLIFLMMIDAVIAATMWDHSSGECPKGSQIPAWAESSLYAIGADGTRGALICSMGVGCNGKAWNTCNVRGDDGDPQAGGPVRPYYDAAHGDSLRSALGDDANHITGLLVSPGELLVTADRAVRYRVYSLITGTVVHDDPAPVLPGQQQVISLGALSAGPYIVIAYDPAASISLGYRAFMQ